MFLFLLCKHATVSSADEEGVEEAPPSLDLPGDYGEELRSSSVPDLPGDHEAGLGLRSSVAGSTGSLWSWTGTKKLLSSGSTSRSLSWTGSKKFLSRRIFLKLDWD